MRVKHKHIYMPARVTESSIVDNPTNPCTRPAYHIYRNSRQLPTSGRGIRLAPRAAPAPPTRGADCTRRVIPYLVCFHWFHTDRQGKRMVQHMLDRQLSSGEAVSYILAIPEEASHLTTQYQQHILFECMTHPQTHKRTCIHARTCTHTRTDVHVLITLT